MDEITHVRELNLKIREGQIKLLTLGRYNKQLKIYIIKKLKKILLF